jgi:hypothetical protein
VSRGLGATQRAVLATLAAFEPRLLGTGEIVARVFGRPVQSAAEYSSISRALASLKRRGLVAAGRFSRWGTPKAVQQSHPLPKPRVRTRRAKG